MKAPITITVVVLAMAFLATGAADPVPRDSEAMARLEDKVSALEQRVQSLEGKLESIAARTNVATRRSARPPRGQSRPRGWRRKEFNGVPYYIIPIEQRPSRSAERTR